MKAAFQKMNESICPASGMKDAVLEKIAVKRTVKFRPLAAVAAIMAVMILATPVMAATVPAFSDWLYQISPEMAERFTPIQKSCTKNGITMEVVSASIHGTTAEAVISFTDHEGGRLSWNSMPELLETRFLGKLANMSGSWGGGINEMEYDEETGTLILVMEQNFSFYSEEEQRYLDVAELFDNKLTISADNLHEYVKQPEVEIPVEIMDSEVAFFNLREERIQMHIGKFSYHADTSTDSWMNQEEYEIIAFGEPVYQVMEELAVTGMTYIDGQLHIQTCVLGDTGEIPIYDLWFEDAQGNRIEESQYMRFSVEGGEYKGNYEEHIFSIPEAELENYKLMCQISEKKTIEGPWQVTFTFTESDYVGEHDDGIPQETAIG